MTAFFPEIDIEKTKSNARRKLREYARWREVMGSSFEQKVTQTYTFDLRDKNGSPSRPVERLAIRRVDAIAELDAIEHAVSNIFDPLHRRLLTDKFLTANPPKDWQIYTELGYERSRFYDIVDVALLAFAEQYRGGCLTVCENRTLVGQ